MVSQAYLFIGQVTGQEALYEHLERAGYLLIFKPTTEYKVRGKVTIKGNVDAELVLHSAAIQFNNYDNAVIVSGDGDFACLIEYLTDKKKLLQILVPNAKYSSLLKPYEESIARLDILKGSLEYKMTRSSGRSKP